MKKILLILICIFALTGCYNYYELDELDVASSILVEHNDGKYDVTVEVYDEKKTKTVKASGKTLTEAFENADRKTAKNIYYRHLNAILLTEDVDIKEVVYFFFRNPDTNDNFAFVYTTETDIYTDKDKNIGELINNNLKQNEMFTFFEIMKNFTNKTRDLTFPIFDGKRFTGIKTLKGTKIIGTLDEKEDNILMPLINKTGTYLDTKCDDDERHFVIKIDSVDTDYKVDKKIKVKVKIEASLRELTCDIDTSKVEGLKKLEKIANDDFKDKVYSLINKFKEDKTDTLGINTLINDKYHNLDKRFYDFDYEVETEISIYKKGLLLK
ncbi:MAG: hypothetical protein J1F35_02000 [Erysipelotrichales bacterium]|nr:hypothetical protein [Erysipelotrichales bacterium]